MLGLFRRASGMWCWVKLVEMWPIRVEAVVVVNVWWSGVDRPRQAFDNRVVWVYDPASCFGMANSTVVLEKQVHRLLLAAASKFGALTPGK